MEEHNQLHWPTGQALGSGVGGFGEGTSSLGIGAEMWQEEAEGGKILKEDSGKDASQDYSFILQLQAISPSKGGTDLSTETPKWIKGLVLILLPLFKKSPVPELISSWSSQSIFH